jgi:hypothetical protein
MPWRAWPHRGEPNPSDQASKTKDEGRMFGMIYREVEQISIGKIAAAGGAGSGVSIVAAMLVDPAALVPWLQVATLADHRARLGGARLAEMAAALADAAQDLSLSLSTRFAGRLWRPFRLRPSPSSPTLILKEDKEWRTSLGFSPAALPRVIAPRCLA